MERELRDYNDFKESHKEQKIERRKKKQKTKPKKEEKKNEETAKKKNIVNKKGEGKEKGRKKRGQGFGSHPIARHWDEKLAPNLKLYI